MNNSIKIKNLYLSALLFSMGLFLRISFIPANTPDMEAYIQWYSFILRNGIAQSLGSQTFGYNPPFIYLLAFATLTRSFLQPIVAIKLISITFDILNSILIYKIVHTQYQEEKIAILAALVFWVAPTIIVNGSFWGQTDSLYTCFLLLTVFMLIREKPTLALIAFALSIAIKAQGVVIVPLLGVLFFKKRIPFYSFLIVPVIYTATFIPTILAGRPIGSLFATYKAQTETFAKASNNAANLFFFVEQSDYKKALYIGIPLATVLLISWVLIYGFKKYEINKSILIFNALVSVALVPFILPKMHDRYFYPADIFSIIMVFFFPKLWPVSIAYQFISLTSYLPYLFGIRSETIIPFAVVINTITVLFLIWKQWTLTSE